MRLHYEMHLTADAFIIILRVLRYKLNPADIAGRSCVINSMDLRKIIISDFFVQLLHALCCVVASNYFRHVRIESANVFGIAHIEHGPCYKFI